MLSSRPQTRHVATSPITCLPTPTPIRSTLPVSATRRPRVSDLAGTAVLAPPPDAQADGFTEMDLAPGVLRAIERMGFSVPTRYSAASFR